MAYFNKVGLILLSSKKDAFLVCEKDNFTTDFILPGGRIESGESELACLKREIKEELDTDLVLDGISFLGEFTDIAAGDPTKDVSIRLYLGDISGKIKPSNEIKKVYWLSKEDFEHKRLSPIIRNKIFPFLISNNIIK